MRQVAAQGPTLVRRTIPGDEALRPYRRIAVHVLERAFVDLTSTGGSAADRESARIFLANSGMVSLWCEIAALDPSQVARRIRGLTTEKLRA